MSRRKPGKVRRLTPGGKPIGGGGNGNPRSIENLRNAGAPPEGNRRAERHGGHSEPTSEEVAPYVARIVAELAARAEAERAERERAIAADAPLRDPATGDLPAADRRFVREVAADEWRLDNVRAFVDRCGWCDEAGNVRPAALLERKLSADVKAGYRELGLTPRSRAALGLDLQRTVDLASAMSEPDGDRRRELLRDAGMIDDQGGGA